MNAPRRPGADQRPTSLTELARIGFADLGGASERLQSLRRPDCIGFFSEAADPDAALARLLRLTERDAAATERVLDDEEAALHLVRLLGASEGIAAFFHRHPEELASLIVPITAPPEASAVLADLLAGIGELSGERARVALRVGYRRHLARLAAWDLAQPAGEAAVEQVAAALSDLAGAALEASLAIARRDAPFPAADVAATRLAIIGMGKSGGRELNYLSDVDVIFVGEGDAEIAEERAVEIATRLAMLTMRGIMELAVEPGLWEVDANLRPEGKDGALVRTLESHVAYYERWAKDWEFQALLKARPLAGDLDLGERYVAAIAPLVWASAGRSRFVESVQRMRGRVTDHIPADQVDVQLKLGPGGLRDIEFTVQLLQLVHGLSDDEVRVRGTLPALTRLVERGYIGRVEAAEFAEQYRFLRLLEHRLQLRQLRRTHLMPTDEDGLRVLARATGLAANATEMRERWQGVKARVRTLHERLFYRPLLSAVASLPDSDLALTSEQAIARLAAIGFHDPKGALAHIAALTTGLSRRAQIQRTLLPVLLRWLADGADPDGGLLAFRRISEELGEAYWFLRLLRDSSGVAQRLTEVLSGARFVQTLFERIPEAAAWLEADEDLRPRPIAALLEEQEAISARYRDDEASAARALLQLRRREMLRLAIGSMLGLLDVQELGPALADINTTVLSGMLAIAHRFGDGIEFGIVAMGRYGGRELGLGSDADVMYVYRDVGAGEEAQPRAERIVRELNRLTEDVRLPLELDINLRPEGKNGAIVRSVESYRAYYARWSVSWEAQALLRARVVVGDVDVLTEFTELIASVRYPEAPAENDIREIKRIKARVEAERLPQGADPKRHLKLGRGSISDVEWLVQLIQLRHAARVPGLQTTSTLGALQAAEEAGLIAASDAARLRDAWLLASRARSAMTLWLNRTTDLLPTDRRDLEGVARLLGYPPGSASQLEEDYLRVTRIARQVFERLFYESR
ncbi:MAG TPA: bifunctional [glutamine synthetase] adenylyltransferase/[glutamine synthetase]-adenylyl-L-tyrosine phosphorylase [Microbacteriaceae bacterium]|nr:bifunctional [glutamine synthetase] adenylyltransferase/[glutamine synthetase]-adenylyl-L-tyrosine phosphorylase [Microbacteriaceae bacterium]